jgi:hypothetical protein
VVTCHSKLLRGIGLGDGGYAYVGGDGFVEVLFYFYGGVVFYGGGGGGGGGLV